MANDFENCQDPSELRVTQPTISLIICTRNRAASMSRCLDALDATDFLASEGELILVNNASTDNTSDVLHAFVANCSFPASIVEEPGLGLSCARNAGLHRAKGNIIAFTDDDCYLEAGYLQKAIEVFESGEFDFCAGRILLYDESDAKYSVNYDEDREIFPPRSYIRPGKIQGANMVFRRSVIETVGMFDPMFGAGTPFRAEDIDYCATVSLAGFVGAFIPELVVYHHHGRKPGDDIENLKRANDYARGAFFAKFILRGHLQYLLGWITYTLRRRNPRAFVGEVRGAYDYLRALRAQGRVGS